MDCSSLKAGNHYQEISDRNGGWFAKARGSMIDSFSSFAKSDDRLGSSPTDTQRRNTQFGHGALYCGKSP